MSHTARLSRPAASLRCYRGAHAAHAHEHAQLLFGLEGRLELDVEGRAARVDAASGLLVPAGMRHAFEAPRSATVWVIDAPASALPDRRRRIHAFALPPNWTPTMLPADLLSLATRAPTVLVRRPVDVQQLQARVQAGLHEDWPTARLAALCALSAPRFHSRWLALTGLTPQAWLRGLRLDRAERLLRSGLPLETTALQVGYRSASALLYALRRDRGRTARQLRRF